MTRNRATAIALAAFGAVLMIGGLIAYYAAASSDAGESFGILGILALGVGSICLTFGCLFGLGKRDGI